MKYLSIDVETTGLDTQYCCILEIAAIYDDGVSKIEDLKRFHCLIERKVVSGDVAAFVMNHDILKMCCGLSEPNAPLLSSYNAYDAFKKWYVEAVLGVPVDPRRPIQQFDELMSKNGGPFKFNMAGKNPAFDRGFLEKEFSMFKTHFDPRHRVVDPAICWAKWEDEVLPNLSQCKERAGIKGAVTHRAMDGALDVVQLVRNALNANLD